MQVWHNHQNQPFLCFLILGYIFHKQPEKNRFILYLFFIEAITVPIESVLLITGVREYAPVLTETMSGFTIPFTIVPIEAVFAVPLFAALIISFYKYVN